MTDTSSGSETARIRAVGRSRTGQKQSNTSGVKGVEPRESAVSADSTPCAVEKNHPSWRADGAISKRRPPGNAETPAASSGMAGSQSAVLLAASICSRTRLPGIHATPMPSSATAAGSASMPDSGTSPKATTSNWFHSVAVAGRAVVGQQARFHLKSRVTSE